MEFNNLLKRYGLKVTKARLAILKVLTRSKQSVSVETIFEECAKDGVEINLSTVYRAVELFEKKRIVDKFALNEGIFTYKLKGEEHKHLLQCSICNKEVEVPCPMRQVEEVVQNETGFTVTEHNLVMKGVCSECKKKMKH